MPRNPKIGDIKLGPLTGLENKVRRWTFAVANPGPNDLLRVEGEMRQVAMRNFRLKPGWAPLAPRTQRERAQQGYGASDPRLVRTGAYRRSWGSVGGWTSLTKTGRGWSFEVGSRMVQNGNRDILEIGGRNPEGFRVPARPVRYMDAEAEKRVHKSVNDMIMVLFEKIVA